MSVNLEQAQFYLDQCIGMIPQGMDLSTYVRPCFMIYTQNAECGDIRIDDRSEQIQFYDADTDLHQVFVTIFDGDLNVCYNGTIDPFGNLSFRLPKPGCYLIEIDVRYTIQYQAPDDQIIEHTFQNVYAYPLEWKTANNYFNSLKNEITCKISAINCEMNKRRCVGRTWHDLMERLYALNNYLYAICNYCLTLDEIDKIACKVRTIKNVC